MRRMSEQKGLKGRRGEEGEGKTPSYNSILIIRSLFDCSFQLLLFRIVCVLRHVRSLKVLPVKSWMLLLLKLHKLLKTSMKYCDVITDSSFSM